MSKFNATQLYNLVGEEDMNNFSNHGNVAIIPNNYYLNLLQHD